MEPRICRQCGAVYRSRGRRQTQQYCSVQCAAQMRVGRRIVPTAAQTVTIDYRRGARRLRSVSWWIGATREEIQQQSQTRWPTGGCVPR